MLEGANRKEKPGSGGTHFCGGELVGGKRRLVTRRRGHWQEIDDRVSVSPTRQEKKGRPETKVVGLRGGLLGRNTHARLNGGFMREHLCDCA